MVPGKGPYAAIIFLSSPSGLYSQMICQKTKTYIDVACVDIVRIPIIFWFNFDPGLFICQNVSVAIVLSKFGVLVESLAMLTSLCAHFQLEVFIADLTFIFF